MIDSITPIAGLALVAFASYGGGVAMLRLLGTDRIFASVAYHTTAATAGMGILGICAFGLAWAGHLTPQILAGTCLVLSAGIVLKRPARLSLPSVETSPYTVWTTILCTIIAVAFGGYIIAALAPPAEGDTLAYHFALPREFLDAGTLVFHPRAVDGAIPLVQHMTYAVALSLGGERIMTLWATSSNWLAAAAVFSMARAYMQRDWALAGACLLLTVPAVIYSGSAGNVEVRGAAFVTTSVLAAIEARRQDNVRLSALAGFLAGLFAASKYTGLMILPLIGLVLIFRRRWFAHGITYACGAILAAGPFYGWIWWNSGDPIFPMLFGIVDYRPGIPWSADFSAAMSSMFETTEKAVPSTVPWALAYPFLITFQDEGLFQSARVGFGPFGFMALPLVLAGLWATRRTIWKSPLWAAIFVVVGFYFTWFLFGAAQRIRHYLPIYPLLLVCLLAAMARAHDAWPWLRKHGIVVVGLALAFQLSIHAVFAINPARYVLGGETRDDFLRRNVNAYDAAIWINNNLGPNDRLLHIERQLVYYLPIHSFYAHGSLEPRVDTRLAARDVGRFWDEMAIEGITHVLAQPHDSRISPVGYAYMADRLVALGCAHEIARVNALTLSSRTIVLPAGPPYVLRVLYLDRGRCPLESSTPVKREPAKTLNYPWSALAAIMRKEDDRIRYLKHTAFTWTTSQRDLRR